jgi:cytochrome b6-f complex iron-sulfur subunit
MKNTESVSTEGGPFSRRRWLDVVLSTGFVSTALAIAYPIWRFLIPPTRGEPPTTTTTAARAADVKVNSGIIFKFGSKPGLLVRSPDGELRAFNAICTHLNCTVQYRPDTSQIWCACHNGMYDLGGNVVSGPPPRPLESFAVNLRGEPGHEEVIVSRSAS